MNNIDKIIKNTIKNIDSFLESSVHKINKHKYNDLCLKFNKVKEDINNFIDSEHKNSESMIILVELMKVSKIIVKGVLG